MAKACRTNHKGLSDAEIDRQKFEAERIERARKALEKKP